MMFWALCDRRLISDQLLMVLIVNKQANSDSQQIWDLPRDEWAAVFSCFAKGRCSVDTHTHTRAHLCTAGDESRRSDLGCSDKDLSPPYTSLPQSARLSADRLAHNDVCICVCVPYLICSPTSTARELHYWGTYLQPCLLHSPLRDRDTVCAYVQVHVCVVLCSWAPSLFPDSEMKCRKDSWSDYHSLLKEEMEGWWKEKETLRVKMRETKTGRQLKIDRQRVTERNRARAFQTRWQYCGVFPEPSVGPWPTLVRPALEGCQGHSASNL